MRLGDENAKADVDSGIYERHYQLQLGDTVLELGAHIGFFTELAARKVGPSGRVIAFEPHSDNFKILRERVGSIPNVTLVHAAAGNKTRLGTLYHNPGNSGGHSLFKCDQHSHGTDVACLKASYYLRQRQARFVKCDAEGSELDSLTDLMRVLKAPVDIAFEAHSNDLYEACKVLLLTNCYQFEPMMPHVGVCYAWKL